MFFTFQSGIGLKAYDGPALPFGAGDYDVKSTAGSTAVLSVLERKATVAKRFPPYLVTLKDGVGTAEVICFDYAEMLGARAYLAPLVR